MQDPELTIDRAMKQYPAFGLFRKLDQSAAEKHRGAQRADRRMETARHEEGMQFATFKPILLPEPGPKKQPKNINNSKG